MPAAFRIIGFFLVFLVSCTSDSEKKAGILKIDSLSVVLMQNANWYNSIDTLQIITKLDSLNRNIRLLDSLINDSLPKKYINYKKLSTSFSLFLQENSLLIRELDLCESQLTDLKHDIQLDLVERKLLTSYIDQEEEAILKVTEKTKEYYKQLNFQLIINDSLNVQMKYLIDSINKQKTGERN